MQDGTELAGGAPDGRPDEVERIFALLSVLDRGQALHQDLVGTGDLMKLLLAPSRASTVGLWRKVTSQPRLTADFALLARLHAIADMPVQIAASDGPLVERRFSGGTIRLVPSRAYSQVYVQIDLEHSETHPRAMVLELSNAGIAWRDLPEVSDGQMLIICDRNDPDDHLFLEAICDPTVKGVFLQ
jgi:hypothetical protein